MADEDDMNLQLAIQRSLEMPAAASVVIATGTAGLECAVCLDPVRIPLALPCAHVFCAPCIQQVRLRSKAQVCPTCRFPLAPLPESIAAGIRQANTDAEQIRIPTAVEPMDLTKQGMEMLSYLVHRTVGMFSIAAGIIVITHPEVIIELAISNGIVQ